MTNEPTICVKIEDLRDLLASIDDNGELQHSEKASVEARLARLVAERKMLWPGRF
jgi:hypothetical protein